MKKLLTFALVATLATSCSEQAPTGFTIEGTTNAFDGKVYLQVLEGKTPVTIDSTTVSEGSFKFAGTVAMPMLAQITNLDGKNLAGFFIENSPIMISVDSSAAPKQALKVSGSSEDSLYRSYLATLDTVTTTDSFTTTVQDFIVSNPKSIAAGYVLFRTMSPRLESTQMRDYAANMDSTVQQSVYIIKMLEKATLMDKTAVGQKFTDFTLNDTLGNPIALSSIAGNGDKWVLLDFWASWCGPCRAENPHVVAAYAEYKDRGFTVFGVSLDKDADNWKAAIVKDGLHWSNVSDLKFWECVPAQQYGVGSIPSNVLIAPDGTIVARNLRGKGLTDKLEEVLGSAKKR